MPDLFRHPRCRNLPCMRDRQPCVYIMANGFNGTLYTGVTSNLTGRVMQHRGGAHEGFTKNFGVVRLVWFDTADTMDAAITTEKRIKKWRRDWKKNLIERDNPHWNDLAVGLGLPPLRSLPRTRAKIERAVNPRPAPTRPGGCRDEPGMTSD